MELKEEITKKLKESLLEYGHLAHQLKILNQKIDAIEKNMTNLDSQLSILNSIDKEEKND